VAFLQISSEIELVRKKIKSLFQDPLCKILMEKSFFTEIQLETLLIDYLTYQTIEPNITQTSKAQARQRAKGKSRGSYNRVLRQSRTKLEKTLYSMLLLGYLGIIGDPRCSTFIEISQRMNEYLEVYRSRAIETTKTPTQRKTAKESAEMETELRKQLYQILSGTNP